MSYSPSTPAIRVYSSGSSRHDTSRSSSRTPTSALPMAIPNAREAPPPPLPPPRYISGLGPGQDPGWQWSNSRPGMEPGSGHIRQGSSLLGGSHRRRDADEFDRVESRRSSQMSTITGDVNMHGAGSMERSEELNSLTTRPSLANFRLQSERQLGQQALHNSAQAYDKQLLSKIGGPTEQSQNSRNSFNKLAGQLKPLSMPEHRYPSLDSPHRWPSASSSGISPGTSFRSPLFDQHSIDTPFTSRHNSTADSTAYEDSMIPQSQRSSVDQGVFLDPELAGEENGMRDLNINDRSPSASEDFQLGQSKKRRASSPPSDHTRDDRIPGNGHDLYHRRSIQMLNRNGGASAAAAAPRYHPTVGSVSSTNSSAGHRDSYASSWNLSIASSVTSYGGERLSPSALSPSGVDSGFGPLSPYAASRNVNRSPRSSLVKGPTQRKPSEADTAQNGVLVSDTQTHSRQNSVAKMQGFFVCECCPKKPKKFDTKEELDLHAMEKQYQCAYCPNRFKNKNEAERHQNSLHLRRHSWSCQALAGVHAAFHPSTIHPAAADVCGYCGEEFPNPANWEVRAEHLCQRHKFGECNQAKKFYRADHFRQHLKHSHAGTSGKWTNMLENACMREESTPPPPNRDKQAPQAYGAPPPVAGPAHVHPQGVLSTIPGVINEVHNES